jgi:hypothetical protein
MFRICKSRKLKLREVKPKRRKEKNNNNKRLGATETTLMHPTQDICLDGCIKSRPIEEQFEKL